jgi:sulfopyruvate decarboxylase TPP-binding subunit
MGEATAPALAAIGVAVRTVARGEDVVETVAASARLAFNTGRAVAVLISQRVIGAKAFR